MIRYLRYLRSRVATVALAGALVIPAGAMQQASADEFSDTLEAMCNHAKECALAEMEDAEGMSESVRAMVMQSLSSMCIGLEQAYGAAIRFHELHDPAVACMRSVTALDCSVMMDGGDQETPECLAYQEAAEKYESD